MTMKRIFALLMLTLLCSYPAMALEERDISSFMQNNIDLATTILRDKKLQKSEKSEKLFAIFDSIFDTVDSSPIVATFGMIGLILS